MKDKSRLLIAGIICLIAVALFIVGMLVLPDVIVMQVQTDGSAGTTLPKILGLILPLALSCVFANMYYKGGNGKNLFVAIIGLIAFGLTFFMNH